jgi:hypothetical protein
MAERFKLGLKAKIYFSTVPLETAVDGDFNEMSNVRDVTLSLEKAEAEVTTRAANGWELVVAALKSGSVEFDMVWDPLDAGFAAILNSFLTDAALAIMVLDGDKATTGSQGLKADMMVTGLSREEPLKGAITAKVTVKPTYSATAPSWFVKEAA